MQAWRVLLWIGLVALLLGFLWLVRGILLPFILCLVIAALLDPSVRWLTRKGAPKQVAILTMVGAFFGGVLLVGAIALPTITKQVTGISSSAQSLTRSIIEDGQRDNFFVRWNPENVAARSSSMSGNIDRILAKYGSTLEELGLPSTRRGLIDQYVDKNRTKLTGMIQGAFDGLFGVVTAAFQNFFWLFLVPVIVTMLLSEMETVKQRGPRWIPPAIRRQTITLWNDISGVFFNYLRGMSLLILYFSIAQTLMLYSMNLPYALLLGVVFGTFYLVPIIGNMISAVSIFLIMGFTGTAGTAAFSVGNPWLYGAVTAVLYLVIGGMFDTFVVPKVVGNSVGLSPVISIFVVMCGQALFGLPGMVIAFPTAGAIKVILDRLLKITSSTDALVLPATPLRHKHEV
jgi:predicted PurR-regulated permease PerM